MNCNFHLLHFYLFIEEVTIYIIFLSNISSQRFNQSLHAWRLPPMLSRGSRCFDHLIKTGLYILLSRFKTFSQFQTQWSFSKKSITLQLIVPPSHEPREVEFSDSVALHMYAKSYRATLYVQTPNRGSLVLNPKTFPRLLDLFSTSILFSTLSF